MNRKVYLGDCHLGKGIFARHHIGALETIFFLTGEFMTYDQVTSMPDGADRTIQIGAATYIKPRFPATYINHDCDPNAGIRDDLCFIALRDIAPGEEIRFDYSTSMLERDWTLQCRCSSPSCRGLVEDFDRLPESLQQYYMELQVVQNFILNELFDAGLEGVAA